jgi:hypothetical protein
MRRCPQCREVKPVEEFAIDRGKASGLASRCKACDRERCRAYYAEHAEARRAAANQRAALRRAQAPPRICERCDQPATSSRHHYCDDCREELRAFGRSRAVPTAS